MQALLILAIVLLVVLGAFAYNALSRARAARAFSAVARAHGLQAQADGRLVGTLEGLGVQVFRAPGEQVDGALRALECTVAETAVPELDRTFVMHTGRSALQMLGAAAAPVAELDRLLQLSFVVPNYSQHPQAVAALQDQALLDALLAAARGHQVSVDAGKVRVFTTARVEDERTLGKLLDQSLAIGRAFSVALTRPAG